MNIKSSYEKNRPYGKNRQIIFLNKYFIKIKFEKKIDHMNIKSSKENSPRNEILLVFFSSMVRTNYG